MKKQGSPLEHYSPLRIIEIEENEKRFFEALWPLYWQAEDTREKGISWRNFLVGCAVYAFRQRVHNYQDHWKVYRGMNTKTRENGRNICAEPIPINSALSEGYESIIGMVVVGLPQADDKGNQHSTLRPCAHCRELMKSHPLITPHTIIVTANPPSDPNIESMDEVVYEVHTFKQLLEAYGEK